MNEDYGKVIECPVCKGQIVHRRRNDDDEFMYFNKDGTYKHTFGKSRGYNEIYCRENPKHDLGEELRDIVFELSDGII